ncbi:CIA30 family protein [Palleronia sediminis]|uniref:CIA30 family protein n=1 Tax=Palleronia sediminis TaxID=2547833 RepID=A0A4R6A4Q9_9RHOB|nr:CIA30 family protein [Palleronia sediminis]TDL77692.1 CIA30 family protein [Palleronia sediminis]
MVIWQAGRNGFWSLVSDRVMGGVSAGRLDCDATGCRMRGRVSLDNDGGFLQMAADLPDAPLDARGCDGLALRLRGNGEAYNIHLRTPDVARPWQSWRVSFTAPRDWTDLRIPFARFAPHRIEGALDTARLSRIGLVAIGRAFEADLSVARLALYGRT